MPTGFSSSGGRVNEAGGVCWRMLTLLALVLAASPLDGLDQIYPQLDALYVDLHKNPELSTKEQRTSARMAEELRKLGYEVTAGVGGTGVVGVLRNGKGPTVLLRTELDALPVEEKTGLPYASTATGVNPQGQTVPVMHACGHDVHMAGWTGAAALPARKVFFVPGPAMASVDSVDVTIFGCGGHGALPHTTVDPVVIAARTILAFQTLISREKDPLEPAVLTVGSIHGGTKYNIVPDEVKLQITLRTFNPEVRKLLLSGIERVAKAEAAAARAPKEPVVKVSESQDLTYNDPALTRRLAAALAKQLGAENVLEKRPEMVAEDFGEFGKAAGVPSVQLRVGAVEPSKYEAAMKAGTPLPSLHSSGFAPDRERTIKAAATVLTLSAVELLGQP